MKKTLVLILCIMGIMGLLLFGCQKKEPTKEEPVKQEETTGYGEEQPAEDAGGYGEEDAGGYGESGGYGE